MRQVFQKTLGGLSPQYYFRQMFFSVLIAAFLAYVIVQGGQGKAPPLGAWFFVIVNTFLYPYSRFVYENVVDFIVGDNVFWVDGKMMIFSKLMTMALCWGGALFVAPIGLAYLYYSHSKAQGPQSD